jgi:hypothetical protein
VSVEDSCRQDPKGEAMGATSKAPEGEVPKPFCAHLTPCALEAGHGAVGLHVCPAGYCSSFGPLIPYNSVIPLFWNGNVYSVSLCVEGM